MATAIQRRRGSSAQHANFTGLSGEITVDTDLNTIIVHDGSTAGGERLARYSELTEFSGNAVTSITTDSNSGLLGGVTEGAANLRINYESLTGNLVPSANNTYSLGSPTNVWKDLYVGAETIFIDGVSLSVVGGGLQFGGNAVAVADDPSVTTDGITEGNTNLYFTDARAQGVISVDDQGGDGSLSYSNATGVITYVGPSAAEARAHFSAGTGIILTDGEIATSSVPNSSLANSDITINGTTIALGDSGSIDTDAVSEGSTNLYYTDQRAQEAISVDDQGGDGSLSYSNTTGVITYVGPSASEARAHFSGGTGVTITDGVVAIGQDVAPGANVDFNEIGGLAAPTAADHAANKAYVDEVAEGLQAKPAVEVATTANLANVTYDNGNAGVGATLTSNVNGAFPEIDGVTLTSTVFGDNGVLVKDQTNAAHNGRYNLTQVGDASNPWILTRCGLCDETLDIPGAFVFVKSGTTLGGTGWVQVVDDPSTFTVGTDDIYVEQFSGSGTFTAGDGIDLTGTEFSVNVGDGLEIVSDNVVLASSAAGTGISYSSGVLNIGQSVGTGDDVTFNNVTVNGGFAGNGSALSDLDADNISTGTLASARLPDLVVGDFADAAVQTSLETFADSDTVLMTAGAIDDRIVEITGSLDASSIISGTLDNARTTATSANTASTIVARDGSGNFSAGTITATATQAQYADVAERYEADNVIEPGTVVCFGGEAEITVCAHQAHHAVAGVISTDPAYLMNEAAGNNDTHPPVALTGRVPCKVTGAVNRGDLMVTSSVAGHAQADNDAAPGRILGKAIGSSEGGEAVIEVLVTLM